MSLTSSGRTYVCPCCGFGIPFSFQETTLLTLQPSSPVQSARGANIPLTRMSHKYRICRQCGFIPDLPSDDENNKWAALNATRLKEISTLLFRDRVSVDSTDIRTQPSVKEPLQNAVTAANGVTPVVTDDEIVTLLELSDELDSETPPSAAGIRAAARATKQ